MKVFLFFLISIFIPDCKSGEVDYSLELAASEVARISHYIEIYNQLTTIEKLEILDVDPAYNMYVIRDLSRAYWLSKDDNYRNIAIDLFDVYSKKRNKDGFLRSKFYSDMDKWYRDPFARDNFLLLQSYGYLNHKPLLDSVESQVQLWLDLVKRNDRNGVMVFPYGIDTDSMETLSYQINPNQNIALARLFSELYFLKDSKFFKREDFKDIVFNEISAMTNLLNKDGSLPLAEHRLKVLDTNYAGYAADMLSYISQQWGGIWDEHVSNIGGWLYEAWPMEHPWNTKQDYPGTVTENFTGYNLIARLPAFYYGKVDSQYAKNWVAFSKAKFPDQDLRLETRWMEHQSLPVSYYLDYDLFFDLPPKVYISARDPNLMIVQLVSERIDSYKVYINSKPIRSGYISASCGEVRVEVNNKTHEESVLCKNSKIIIKKVTK